MPDRSLKQQVTQGSPFLGKHPNRWAAHPHFSHYSSQASTPVLQSDTAAPRQSNQNQALRSWSWEVADGLGLRRV